MIKRLLEWLLLDEFFVNSFQRDFRMWYAVDHTKYHYFANQDQGFLKLMNELKKVA
jgi:hypothetical protein